MTDNEKMAFWSIGGLAGTLFIAWYFSRKTATPTASAATPAPESQTPTIAPMYTFNLPPIDVPAVTGGTLTGDAGGSSSSGTVGAPPANENGCGCQRCASSTDISGGKILSSGNFVQRTSHAINNAMLASSGVGGIAQSGTPTGGLLITQYNGGLPLPSPTWWANDPIYRQAYVAAYSAVVEKMVSSGAYNRPMGGALMTNSDISVTVMQPLNYNMSSKDYATVANAVTTAGNALKALYERMGKSNDETNIEMRTLSAQANQWMTLALEKSMQAFGDPYAPGGSATIGVPDQQVQTIQ